MNTINTKYRGVRGVIRFFFIILFSFYLFNYQVSSSPVVSYPPILSTNAFVAPPLTITILPPMRPSQFIIPPLSARQACIQTPGWQWREGGGFAMCFRPGHAMCPAGHPWMRRMTPHYTICASLENPAWRLPDMNAR